MVATARAASLREDKYALQIIHERSGLCEIGGGRTVLHGKAVTPAHHAPRTSGHFRHEVRAKTLHDLVERAGNGRERSESLDQLIAAGDGFAALDRLAVTEDRPGREIAVAVSEGLIELHREGIGEVIQHVLARRDVHAHVIPFFRWNFGEPPLHQRLAR